ncbi:hypothetical protein [Paraburkholderia kururiensis]|uniref:hypothetical protein n=1 Tax=Paraburkholderia kururiensis TaxID=984307 RepID=UPI0039A64F7C
MPVRVLGALHIAVSIGELLASRVQSALPVRASQWVTLGMHVRAWRVLLADDAARTDARTRSHLSLVVRLMEALLAQHRAGDEPDLEAWEAVIPTITAAAAHLNTFSLQRRKAASRLSC